MIILTDLPRDTGVGQYVVDLANSLKNADIYFRKQMSFQSYDLTTLEESDRSIKAEAFYYGKLKFLRSVMCQNAHIAWEGFGPIFGKETKLITVHHILPNYIDNSPDRTLKMNLIRKLATDGYSKIAKWGVLSTVPSHVVKNEFVRFYGADASRIKVIPHAVDTTFFRKLDKLSARKFLGLPEIKFILLSIGHDDIRKNLRTIHKAFMEIKKQIKDVMWVHLGESEYLRKISNGKSDILILSGVKRHQMPQIYNACDVVLLPSYNEGFSRTLLEALACETYVIHSNIEIFREQMGDFFKGCVPGEYQCLVSQILEVYNERIDFDFSGMRRRIEKQFSIVPFAKRYGLLYEMAGLE